MDNPYQSPQFDPHAPYHNAPGEPMNMAPSSLVQQVRIVAILNAVQGGLEILAGLMFVFAAVFVPALIAMDADAAREMPEGMQQNMTVFLICLYGGMGVCGLIAGITRIVATFRNWHFRGRTLGIASLIVGALSWATCYCIPTSIAMLIYGLVVYLNSSVALAFEMGEAGQPAEKILYEFSTYRPRDTKPQP